MTFSENQQTEFLQALQQKMPFGQYQGHRLMDLPGHYLAWFKRQGFPDNKLGRQMALVFELDYNGLLAGIRHQLTASEAVSPEKS